MTDNDGKHMKLWLLTNAPSPYQVEYLKALQGHGSVDLEVSFMREGYQGMAWQPAGGWPDTWGVMHTLAPKRWKDTFRFHPAVFRKVFDRDIDVFVLSGLYTSPTFFVTACLLSMMRRPWVMWLEQPWPDDYRPAWASRASARSAVARSLRRGLLGWLVRRASGVFCIGQAAVDAYTALGAAPDKLFNIPYACDVERFGSVPSGEAEAVKEECGFAGKTVFLYVGLLTERKGVDVLIRAFSRLAEKDEEVALLLLGDGDQRDALTCSVPDALRSRVHFAGRQSQDKLPRYYAASDVFVFPSRHDGWAVVINEACGAGLPVVVSAATGAGRDLVRDGYNGFVVPRDDEEGFLKKMTFLAEHSMEREAYSHHSQEIAREITLERSVTRFEEALGILQRKEP